MIREVNEVVGMHSNARQAVLETNNPDGSGEGGEWGCVGASWPWCDVGCPVGGPLQPLRTRAVT